MATIMQNACKLRAALNTGNGLSWGAWQMLPGTNLSRTMARTGFDWVMVDCEHGNFSDAEMHESVNAIAACGVSPLVRIAGNEGWMVKRALDAGAHGILVPLLYTVEDAIKLVESAKFPPMGKRGFGSPFSPGCFSMTGDLSGLEYLQNANQHLLTCVQIETKEALEAVDKIAQVPGVDVLFVGPWDLGNNIGHPVQGDFDPELKEAISRIREAAATAGKKSGIYCTGGESARKYADDGFQMISCITDMVAIPTSMAENLSKAKGTYGHAAAQAVKGAAYSAINAMSSQDNKK